MWIPRKLVIGLLALGTLGGLGAGFASLGCKHRARRDAFERHVAAVCVDAARREAPPAPSPAHR